MKNLIKITILLFTINSFSQTIVDIEEMPMRVNAEANTYYKDINNYYDTFVGTWIYTDGTTSFKLVFQKGVMIASLGNPIYYIDDVVGEYQYIEGGVELINTLSNSDPREHSIRHSSLLKSTYRPHCNDCPTGERRMRIILSDNTRDLSCTLVLKRIEIGGQITLEAIIVGNGVGTYDINNPPAYLETTTPTGTFIFIKQ